MQSPIAEAPLLAGQLPQAAPQFIVSPSASLVSDRLAIGPDQATRPALAHLVGRHETSDSLALGDGRQNFFVRRSFKAELSSMASARSRFSFPFSSSSCFSRLASETSIPPYFAFQA